MKEWVHSEGVTFLAINLIAPVAYGVAFTAVPTGIALYVSSLVFVLLQVLNFLRIRKGDNLTRCYIAIIALNVMTLITIGNIAFLSSVPAIWGILTSLL